MKIKKIISVILATLLLLQIFSTFAFAGDGYLDVTDFIDANSGADISDEIQKIIDENPNCVLFFPDGEYLLSKPIYTPADPTKSVSLKLSDFAILRATGEWQEGEAIVQLGGKDPYNTTSIPGSNYSLEGGVIDGSGVADGVSINSGRETAVRFTSIKNTIVGLHIMHGANNGSSDADIYSINIMGNAKEDSVGILLEGHDNTLSNIRIGAIHTGVIICSAGNVLRDIHPLWGAYEYDFMTSCGFLEECDGNLYDYCYSDQFATGFRTTRNSKSVFTDCYCYWWSSENKDYTYTGFRADKKFDAKLINFRMGGLTRGCDNVVLSVGQSGGDGVIDNLVVEEKKMTSNLSYKAYEKSENIFDTIIKMFWKLVLPLIVVFNK